MTVHQSSLSIDFGMVGSRSEKHAFCIRLDTEPLTELIEAAAQAHRVYELFLIDRPGDVWDYVWVVLEAVPRTVADRAARARIEWRSTQQNKSSDWPHDRIPFKVFDRLFSWAMDDTEAEDHAWLSHRNTEEMKTFAQHGFAMVRAGQLALACSDQLLRHVAASVRSGKHPYCYFDREAAIARGTELPLRDSQHTDAFYDKLRALLRNPNLFSVAYRADGDHQVLRMMASEQRRRANRTGHTAEHALPLSALVNHATSNEAWESEITYFDAGLAHGDLFVEGGGLGECLKEMLEARRRMPGSFILSVKDEGSITGFEKESGDGWVLYRNPKPETRRISMQSSCDLFSTCLAPVLSFSAKGATVFSADKSVVFVGEDVSISARSTLALAVFEWQQLGVAPLLVVAGTTTPFELAGCKSVLPVPKDCCDNNTLTTWFQDVLACSQPWIDVVVTLHAPVWANQVLAHLLPLQNGPWPCWVVATESDEFLDVDHVLNGDLSRLLTAALQRAQSKRPQRL